MMTALPNSGHRTEIDLEKEMWTAGYISQVGYSWRKMAAAA